MKCSFLINQYVQKFSEFEQWMADHPEIIAANVESVEDFKAFYEFEKQMALSILLTHFVHGDEKAH